MTESSEASSLADAWLHEQATAERVRRLCALATSADPATAKAGTDAIFRRIIEPLGDSFDPRDCGRYREFFAKVVDFCRTLPAGRAIDESLRAFGLHTREDLSARARRLVAPTRFEQGQADEIKRILVLSRVTLGADVAVTSVVLSRLKNLFTKAEICLLGNPKAGSLFASDGRIQLVAIDYQRAGTLLERLDAWPRIAAAVGAKVGGLRPEEYLVVDPDSRLTQLGLLPIAPEEARYLFFESRSYAPNSAKSLGELTDQWLDEIFGLAAQPSRPYVALASEDAARGARLRASTPSRVAVVNLGVGENPEKRLHGAFEIDLLLLLLRAGYRVVLDRGAGEEELQRTGNLIEALREKGHSVAAADSTEAPAAGVLTWEGSLSGLAGLMQAADLYVGYDSAGGHIAAALGVPAIDVFAGAVSSRMRQRWSPWGRQPARVLAVDPGATPTDILRRIQELLE